MNVSATRYELSRNGFAMCQLSWRLDQMNPPIVVAGRTETLPFTDDRIIEVALDRNLYDLAKEMYPGEEVGLVRAQLRRLLTPADCEYQRDYLRQSLVVPVAGQTWPIFSGTIALQPISESDYTLQIVPRTVAEAWPVGQLPLIDEEVAGVATILLRTGDCVIREADTIFRWVAHDPSAPILILEVDWGLRGSSLIHAQTWWRTADWIAWQRLIERLGRARSEWLGIPPADHEFWSTRTCRDLVDRYPALTCLTKPMGFE